MKKVLILLYITIVAAMSVSARAEQVDLLIDSVQFDASTQVFQIQGSAPSPCITNPSLLVTETKPGTIELRILGERPEGFCVQVMGSSYALTVDAGAIRFEVERSGELTTDIYRVLIPAANFEAELDLGSSISRAFSSKIINGKIEATNGKYFLITTSGSLELISPSIELENLDNQNVHVLGHLQNEVVVGPAFSLNGSFNQPANKKVSGRFMVTGLSI